MTRRQCTKLEERKRIELEDRLQSLVPISPEVREMMSLEGFSLWFDNMKHLYPTKEDAYEALEYHYQRLTGRRRYSELRSFLKARMIYNRKHLSVKE